MPVAFDAATAGVGLASPTSPQRFVHVCSNSSRLVVVSVTFGQQTPNNDSQIKNIVVRLGSTAMTLVGRVQSGGSNTGFTEIYYFVGPSPGAQVIDVSWSSSVTVSELIVGSASFTGINETMPIDTAVTQTGNSSTASVSITTTIRDMVVATCCAGSALNAISSGTQAWLTNVDNNSAAGNAAMAYGNNATSQTLTYPISLSDNWAWMGFNINAGPLITSEPSDSTVNCGSAATFSVSATASNGSLSYQWKVSTDRGATYSNVSGGSGATTSSYTTPATNLGDHLELYRCEVTDSDGTTITRAALLSVTPVLPAAWLTQ